MTPKESLIMKINHIHARLNQLHSDIAASNYHYVPEMIRQIKTSIDLIEIETKALCNEGERG